MKIKYLGNFGKSESLSNRDFSLAAVTKMTYIAKAIVRNNYSVEIVSQAITKNKSGIYPRKKVKLFEGCELQEFTTFGSSNRIMKRIDRILAKVQMLIYLLINTKKNETIIAYHSLNLYYPIMIAKRLKKFKLVLEVNEIYANVRSNNKWDKRERRLIDLADKYIFISELLNKELNSMNKPYVINHGTYLVEKNRDNTFGDKKTHIIYAGTLDRDKGGATTAVSISEFLTSSYHIHILGFGNSEEKELLLKQIDNYNKLSECKVTYDGVLSGEDYKDFLQKCDIGLSTQNPIAKFNDTSFPSKVLVYIANGLKVVAGRIDVLTTSEIAESINFYDIQDPKHIAEVIKNIDTSHKYNERKILLNMDEKFGTKIENLLKEE